MKKQAWNNDVPLTDKVQLQDIKELDEMEDNETVPHQVQEFMDEKNAMLKQPFNFYTFGLDINSSQRVDVMNNIYSRLLTKELIDK